MKSILLTSTALVAFAGAASAGGHVTFSWSGEASAEYNTLSGYATSTEATLGMSADLDNGLTASAEISLNADEGDDADEVTYGSITLASDTASLTFGTGLDGAVFTATGDDYLDGVQDGEEGVDGIVGMFTLGGADVTVSAPIAEGDADLSSDDIEIGVTTDVAGWAVGLGLMGSGEYALTASGAAGGADLSFGMSSEDEWDVEVSYPFGPVTASFSTDQDEAWTVGVDYDGGDYSAGFEYNEDESWEVSLGYAAGAVVVDAAIDSDEVITLGATYDVGNGMTVGAGLEDEDTYAFVDYDLGGGASAYIEFADVELEEVGPSERDIAEGTTVGLSFEF